MPAFILRMTPPNGLPPEYLPPGFGFSVHAHAMTEAEAERFPTAAAAMRRGNAYRWPPAFWESERRHAARQAERFRAWTFEAVEIAA